MDDKLSRRTVLQRGAAFGTLAVFDSAACSKQSASLVCTDTFGLSPSDLSARTALAYVDNSVEPGKTCTRCRQFIPNTVGNTCGTCRVVKGPINPNGTCKSFLAK
jgi:hypothetical protein